MEENLGDSETIEQDINNNNFNRNDADTLRLSQANAHEDISALLERFADINPHEQGSMERSDELQASIVDRVERHNQTYFTVGNQDVSDTSSQSDSDSDSPSVHDSETDTQSMHGSEAMSNSPS